MPSNIAILGSGPAGLAAATAAINSGCIATIVSNSNNPSVQHGCQYLHAPVPGFEWVPHTRVGYYLNGTPEQYRRKVYGEKWKGKVSPEDFIGEHDAWDIRSTYAEMWMHLHELRAVRFLISPTIVAGVLPSEFRTIKFDKIISTIPAPALCGKKEHSFKFHTIYASGSTARLSEAQDTIICDGTDEHTWYRNACVFGYRTTEWSHRPTNGEVVASVSKPLTTDCTCHPDIYRIGRYGKWLKSYLVHQAYPDVMEILKK